MKRGHMKRNARAMLQGKRQTTFTTSCVALACLMLGGQALAQGTPADKAAAEALFQQGQRLLDAQRVEEACEKFRASQQLDAGLGTMLYLADCYEQAGRTASAWAVFKEAASVAASRGETSREEIARVRAEALEARLSHVIIRTPQPLPSAAMISRDGSPVPSALLGVAIPVDPGSVTVQVEAPGYEASAVSVAVPRDATEPVEIVLPALKALPPTENAPVVPAPTPPGATLLDASPATEPVRRSGLSTEETAGLVLGGVGLVAAGLATVFTLVGSSSNQESLKHCSREDTNSCNRLGTELRDQALGELSLATVFGVISAATLGTGIALYVALPDDDVSRHATLGMQYAGEW